GSVLSYHKCQLSAEPPEGGDGGGPKPSDQLWYSLLHTAHGATDNCLRAGCVRGHSSAGGIARSNGGIPAIGTRSHVSDADLEHRPGGGPGGFHTGSNGCHAEDHQDREGAARLPQAAVRCRSGV